MQSYSCCDTDGCEGSTTTTVPSAGALRQEVVVPWPNLCKEVSAQELCAESFVRLGKTILSFVMTDLSRTAVVSRLSVTGESGEEGRVH